MGMFAIQFVLEVFLFIIMEHRMFIVYFFVVLHERPTREFFAHKETSP